MYRKLVLRTILICKDPHYFRIPDQDPHQSEKPDPDPHQSEKPDPHPHQIEKPDTLQIRIKVKRRTLFRTNVTCFHNRSILHGSTPGSALGKLHRDLQFHVPYTGIQNYMYFRKCTLVKPEERESAIVTTLGMSWYE
jgi:hypothetical protein